MKAIIQGILIALLAAGCSFPAQEAGFHDIKNTSKEPYLFIYKGNFKNAMIPLKRILVLNGFSIASDDTEAGILVTNPKSLKDDETLNSGFGAGLFNSLSGTRIKEEKGVVSFVFDNGENETTIIRMTCTLSSKETQDTIFGARDKSGERVLMQGDPLPMKMKSLLINSKNFFQKVQ